jgi:sugar phosphate isomerase/epimerase
MKLGLLTYNIAREWDLDTLLSKAKELGFEGVELRVDRDHAHGVEVNLTSPQRKEVAQKMADSGLTNCGLGSGCRYDSPEKSKLSENVEHTKALLQLTADLGGAGLKVFGNNFHEDQGISKEATVAQVGKAVKECAQTANDLGVELRFEMHGDFNPPEHCLKVLELADEPSVSLIYNSDPRDVVDGSVAGTIAKVRKFVTHIHMHDMVDPRYPYQEMLGIFRDSGFEGFAVAEIADSPDPERVLKYFVALYHAYLGE